MLKRSEGSKAPGIRTGYLEVREQETEPYDRGVDQTLSSPELLLQTKVRKDSHPARVYGSRSKIRGNVSTKPSAWPNDLSASSGGSPLVLSLGLSVRSTPRALFPTLFPGRLLSTTVGLFSRGFVRLTSRSRRFRGGLGSALFLLQLSSLGFRHGFLRSGGLGRFLALPLHLGLLFRAHCLRGEACRDAERGEDYWVRVTRAWATHSVSGRINETLPHLLPRLS